MAAPSQRLIRLLLLAADHALLSHVSDGAPAAWRAMHAPASYLERSWPLRHAALSPDAQHVAVAGRRGALLRGP